MHTSEVIDRFYDSPEGLTLPVYTRADMGVLAGVTPQLTPGLRPEASVVDEKLLEAARSLRIIEHGDSTFEIAEANLDVTNGDILLHISTYSSAISSNPGNLYEFAAQAARYSDYRHLYVASFGNGGTSPLLPGDAHYAKKTGRFIREDKGGNVYPLLSLGNLYKALEKEGLSPTHIMGADSAGSHYSRGLAVAMPEGQVNKAFFSETSGFVHHSVGSMVVGMAVKEQFINAKLNRELTTDPEAMDDAKQQRAREALERYSDLPSRQALAQRSVKLSTQLGSMWTSLNALRRGPNGDKNPLVEDTEVFLAQQPKVRLTHGMAENDPLYKTPETTHSAARSFLGRLSSQGVGVEVIIIPGMTHAYNTYFPELYQSIKKHALRLAS